MKLENENCRRGNKYKRCCRLSRTENGIIEGLINCKMVKLSEKAFYIFRCVREGGTNYTEFSWDMENIFAKKYLRQNGCMDGIL